MTERSPIFSAKGEGRRLATLRAMKHSICLRDGAVTTIHRQALFTISIAKKSSAILR
jgi:hypothetical protein